MRRQVGLKLDDDLLQRLDAARGEQSRTEAIEAAIERWLIRADAVAQPMVLQPEGPVAHLAGGYKSVNGRVTHLPRCSCPLCKPSKAPLT